MDFGMGIVQDHPEACWSRLQGDEAQGHLAVAPGSRHPYLAPLCGASPLGPLQVRA